MPEKVLIIGGGLAGISAAIRLAGNKTFTTTLLEASPKIGGRVTSFFDSEFDCILDNGQHLLLGCYSETLSLLDILNKRRKLNITSGLFLPYLLPDGTYKILQTPPRLPYPFSLLTALMRFDVIPLASRLKQILFAAKMLITSERSLKGKSVAEWFDTASFTADERELLWEVISTGALNTNPKEAEARLLLRLLRIVFLRGSKNYRFMVPAEPLHEVFAGPAIEYLSGQVEICTGERVESVISTPDKRVVTTNKGKEYHAERLIFAIPPFALQKISTNLGSILPDTSMLEYSPIVSIHLKCNPTVLPYDYVTLLKSPVQWVFRQPYGLSLVISAADTLTEKSNEELVSLAESELSARGVLKQNDVSAGRVVREKRATIKCTPYAEQYRPGVTTGSPNIFIAGDWINTGYPSTIEGAILSGKLAVKELLRVSGQ